MGVFGQSVLESISAVAGPPADQPSTTVAHLFESPAFFSWEYDYVSEAQEEAKGGENQQIQEVVVSDSNANAGYANFCRVSSTPEELILDLGLNPTPYATGKVEVKVTHRIILNHYTAKRLWHALSMALQRHEQAFGVLETDVRKRVRLPQGG
jgi:hypothetical protein